MESQDTDMTAPMRTYFVAPPVGGKVHRMRANNLSEGSKTLCGRLVVRGWKWAVKRIRNRPVCKYCEC